MAWIKVHAGTERKKYWFNTDSIIHIINYSDHANASKLSGHKAIINFSGRNGDEQLLAVWETPEEIIEMISAAVALADKITS